MEISKAKIDGNGNVVIQNIDNLTITINSNNTLELRQFLIDCQDEIRELPLKILKLMETKKTNDLEVNGANIHLGLNIVFETMCNLPTGETTGISFSVTITNLTKENRYFYAPFFKLSVPPNNGLDTFIFQHVIGQQINFPKKLEFGEVITQTYIIPLASKTIFEEALSKDPNATIQVVTSTTIGEIYQSNEYPINKLSENFKYAK